MFSVEDFFCVSRRFCLPYITNCHGSWLSCAMSVLPPYSSFQSAVGICWCQCGVIAYQNPIIGLSKLRNNNFFANAITCHFWLPTASTILALGKTGLNCDTKRCHTENAEHHIEKISRLSVRFFLLPGQVSNNQNREWTTSLNMVGV